MKTATFTNSNILFLCMFCDYLYLIALDFLKVLNNKSSLNRSSFHKAVKEKTWKKAITNNEDINLLYRA